MPLSGSGNTLGTAIADAIDGLTESQLQDKEVIWQTISNVIVAHIVANTVVNVTSVTGVTTGAGVSGPGTGTVG